jgi:hypothetical protein
MCWFVNLVCTEVPLAGCGASSEQRVAGRWLVVGLNVTVRQVEKRPCDDGSTTLFSPSCGERRGELHARCNEGNATQAAQAKDKQRTTSNEQPSLHTCHTHATSKHPHSRLIEIDYLQQGVATNSRSAQARSARQTTYNTNSLIWDLGQLVGHVATHELVFGCRTLVD